MSKKKCKVCGDIFTPNKDEFGETDICDECFSIREESQNMPDESYSDADSGL